MSGQPPVYYADAIVPQIPAGCGWTFSIVLLNLSRRDISFKVNFWPVAGVAGAGETARPRLLPITGIGSVGSVTGVIPADGSYTISSDESVRDSRTGSDCSGWAEVNSEEALGGYVLLNLRSTVHSSQTIGGIQVQQVTEFSVDTTVPLASRFASRFVVPFETTSSYDNAFTLVNPSFQTAADVLVTYRDESGQRICDEFRHLRPGEQQTYVLKPSSDPSAPPVCGFPSYSLLRGPSGTGMKGVAEFSTVNLEFSGLALRFGALGFVSYPIQPPIGR